MPSWQRNVARYPVDDRGLGAGRGNAPRTREPDNSHPGESNRVINRRSGRAARRSAWPGRCRRRGRQRPRMVRLRRLRLFRPGHLPVVLPGERSAVLAAADLRGVRRRLRDAPGRLDPVRHLRRPRRPTQGIERGHIPDGVFDRGDRPAANLPAGRHPRADPACHHPAAAGPLGRRRMGRIDRLSRGIRPRGTSRLYRLLAAGQRRRRLPAGVAECGLHQRSTEPRRRGGVGLARPIRPRHRGRAARRLPALAP